MKEYFRFFTVILVLTIVIFESITLGILLYGNEVYRDSYQSVIQDKYRILMETNDPKIIVVSGSSSAFGLDQNMLEEASGYKVANLGLHAGFGHLFHSELAKGNINEGDIVLLGYEYGWEDGFEAMDQSLVMSGIDENVKMYLKIPICKWKDIVGYLFKYAEMKNSYEGAHGDYSREAFDSETGQMIMIRDYEMEYSVEEYGVVDMTDVKISSQAITYLLDFKDYVEERGASIYFVAPPLVEDCIIGDYDEFDKLKRLEEEKIGIPYISNPIDYIFPCELMSNANYHCNSDGEKVRTQLLIADLQRAAIIE